MKYIAGLALGAALLAACTSETVEPAAEEEAHALNVPPPPANPPPLLADGSEGPHAGNSALLTWDTVPAPYEIYAPVAYTLPTGETHWYEVVFLPEGGVNWVQAKVLAEDRGGYLVSFHSQEENDFAFSLVTDRKFWYGFDHGEMDDGTKLINLSGPFLGGFQPDGAPEPDGGWLWASGEPMTWTNWQHEGLEIGINIPPDNQPNNSRGQQNVMAFGEVDVPEKYWSDVPHRMGTYNTRLPSAHGFIIEYNDEPAAD